MSRNKQTQGYLGCFVWLIIIMVIFASCQHLFKSNQVSTSRQSRVKTPVRNTEYDRLMRKAYRLYKQKACQEALGIFQKALERRKENPIVLKAIENTKACVATQMYYRSMNQGYRLSQEEKYAEALASFSKALEQRPQDIRSLQAIKNIGYAKPMQFSLQLLGEDDYETALVVLKTALKRYPNEPIKSDRIKQAIGKKAVEYFKSKPPTHQVVPRANGKSKFYTFAMFLSSQLAKEGATDDALIITERVWREHPNDEPAKQLMLDLAKKTAKKHIQRLITTKSS
jgi:tetratricopeptide (TPR) repeat protein